MRDEKKKTIVFHGRKKFERKAYQLGPKSKDNKCTSIEREIQLQTCYGEIMNKNEAEEKKPISKINL